ncbi:retrovirus-related pol polyprotein from transposon TNT 1-94 [Tanacetum coccineum]
MDDPNITMEEYIRLEEEKSHRRGKVYNWETAMFGKIWDNEDVHDLEFIETDFPAIVFNDMLTSEATPSCEPTVSSLNDNKIDFRISFDEFDDEDYTVIYDKNSFSYKIISVNDLKTDSENDNEKVNMPSFPPPNPTVSCFDDLYFFKEFENEFPAIVYNDALTSKSDLLTEPTGRPVNDVPQLVDKKGGSYAAIAPKLKPGKFNKWKKRMLCYLAGMEPYYLKCIKDGPFQPKTAEGDAKPESQWTHDERRVVVQDQRLKSIIISCLPDDIMESVISCVLAKETWIDLVHSFEGPLDTKENRIMDLKLKYQTFMENSTESLLQTYTRYKALLNELENDGVNYSKHKINVGFVNSLPEKWLTFSQGLRSANHTQTLDLADIYERFVYDDNLIQKRYSDTKKALITTPSSTQISTAFYSNNVIQDFQEKSDNEVDERTSEEYLRDLDIEYHERALLANSKRFIKRRNNFSGQKANENTECYKCGNKGHFARDYFSKTSEPSYKSPVNNYSSMSKGFQPKAEYKKMKAKLALLEASPSSSQNSKSFQPKNKGLVAKTFYWDKEEVSNEEEVTHVKVLMALADDELTVGKSHARNDEWVDITMRQNENENIFAPTSMGYVQEMVPKAKDWVERLNLDSKLPNFNTRRILVPKSQDVNESLETSNTPESSKDSEAEFLTPLPPLKILQGASPSSMGNAIDLSTLLSQRETRPRYMSWKKAEENTKN